MFAIAAVEQLFDRLVPILLMPYTRTASLDRPNPLFYISIDHEVLIAELKVYCYSETIDFDMIIMATEERYTQSLIVANFEDLTVLCEHFLQRINATFCVLMNQL